MVTVLRVYTLYLTPSQDTIQLDANIITYKDLNDLEVSSIGLMERLIKKNFS